MIEDFEHFFRLKPSRPMHECVFGVLALKSYNQLSQGFSAFHNKLFKNQIWKE